MVFFSVRNAPSVTFLSSAIIRRLITRVGLCGGVGLSVHFVITLAGLNVRGNILAQDSDVSCENKYVGN